MIILVSCWFKTQNKVSNAGGEQTDRYIPMPLFKLIDDIGRVGRTRSTSLSGNGDFDEINQIIDTLDTKFPFQSL